MTKEEFVDLSTRMVLEYYNRYIKKSNEKDITNKEIELEEYYYNDMPNEEMAILSTNRNEYVKYSITRNIETNEISSYAFLRY